MEDLKHVVGQQMSESLAGKADSDSPEESPARLKHKTAKAEEEPSKVGSMVKEIPMSAMTLKSCIQSLQTAVKLITRAVAGDSEWVILPIAFFLNWKYA